MKINELIAKLKDADPTLIANKAQEKMALRVLRGAFGVICEEIDAADAAGTVRIGGLGRFRVKNVQKKDKMGETRTERVVVFVAKKPKAETSDSSEEE